MASAQGSFTFRRYAVKGGKPDVHGEDFLARLGRHAFKPIDRAREEVRSVGWISPRHIYDTAFTLDKILVGGYVRFAFRVDRKRAPGRLVKAHLQIEEEAYRKEHDVAKVPFAVRKELREQVRDKILKETPPSMAAHEVIWNLRGRRVYFGGLSADVNGEFVGLFEETFGLELTRLDPLGLANVLCDDVQAINRLVQVAPVRLGVVFDRRGA